MLRNVKILKKIVEMTSRIFVKGEAIEITYALPTAARSCLERFNLFCLKYNLIDI